MVCVEYDFFLVGVFEGLAALDVCVRRGVGGGGGGRGDDGGGAREAGEVAAEDYLTWSVLSIQKRRRG